MKFLERDRVVPYENSGQEELKGINRIDFEEEKTILCLLLVTDPMQRESAIADDYWNENLKNKTKDSVEIKLQNIEQEYVERISH